MLSRDIIIRSIGIIGIHGYVGKTTALINDTVSTADAVRNSFKVIPKVTALEKETHGATADDIAVWLKSIRNNEYLQKCASVLHDTNDAPDSAYSLLPYTKLAFEASKRTIDNNSKISGGTVYIGARGTDIKCSATVLDIVKCSSYDKVYLKESKTGALATAFRQYNTLQSLKIGDIITLSAKVAKHISGNPTETRLTKVKLIKDTNAKV